VSPVCSSERPLGRPVLSAGWHTGTSLPGRNQVVPSRDEECSEAEQDGHVVGVVGGVEALDVDDVGPAVGTEGRSEPGLLLATCPFIAS
jgi:hypothetical protein